jgi:hypothetical protein
MPGPRERHGRRHEHGPDRQHDAAPAADSPEDPAPAEGRADRREAEQRPEERQFRGPEALGAAQVATMKVM